MRWEKCVGLLRGQNRVGFFNALEVRWPNAFLVRLVLSGIVAAHPTRLYSSSKINFKTKKETWYHQGSTVSSEGLDGYHVLYSLLYTTASLPMMLGPKAQAMSYHVPTKYLFLPNSQAQSLEIPFCSVERNVLPFTSCSTTAFLNWSILGAFLKDSAIRIWAFGMLNSKR